MRAEAQAHVDQINSALALLRRFLDWDRALRRLDELNAKVEDPSLWNDPAAAQKLMRERQKLDTSLSAVTRLTNELHDATALIEMAEAENDAAMVTDAMPTSATQMVSGSLGASP